MEICRSSRNGTFVLPEAIQTRTEPAKHDTAVCPWPAEVHGVPLTHKTSGLLRAAFRIKMRVLLSGSSLVLPASRYFAIRRDKLNQRLLTYTSEPALLKYIPRPVWDRAVHQDEARERACPEVLTRVHFRWHHASTTWSRVMTALPHETSAKGFYSFVISHFLGAISRAQLCSDSRRYVHQTASAQNSRKRPQTEAHFKIGCD